jgi:hypothetical protein
MAKPRPYKTYYSDGSLGRSSTVHAASLRAFKKVIEGVCRNAVVTNGDDRDILTVEKRYNTVAVSIRITKEFK